MVTLDMVSLYEVPPYPTTRTQNVNFASHLFVMPILVLLALATIVATAVTMWRVTHRGEAIVSWSMDFPYVKY